MNDYESLNTDDDGKKNEAYDEPVALYDLTFETESGLKGFIYAVPLDLADRWEKSIRKAYKVVEITRKDHVDADITEDSGPTAFPSGQ
jgi:hypothetical protein